MNSTASQSSNSGWLGFSPWVPNSSGVLTSPVPSRAPPLSPGARGPPPGPNPGGGRGGPPPPPRPREHPPPPGRDGAGGHLAGRVRDAQPEAAGVVVHVVVAVPPAVVLLKVE